MIRPRPGVPAGAGLWSEHDGIFDFAEIALPRAGPARPHGGLVGARGSAFVWAAAVLKGYRTYIIGWLMVVSVIVQFLVGDLSVWDLMRQLPEIFNGLGIITLRAGIAAHFRGLASATDQPVPHVKGGTSTEWLTRPTGADRSAPDSSDDPT